MAICGAEEPGGHLRSEEAAAVFQRPIAGLAARENGWDPRAAVRLLLAGRQYARGLAAVLLGPSQQSAVSGPLLVEALDHQGFLVVEVRYVGLRDG